MTGAQGRMDIDLDEAGHPVRAVILTDGVVRMGMIRESKGQSPATFAKHFGYRIGHWENAGHAWIEAVAR